MPITEEIERLAVERASAVTIEHVAREQGMVSLRDDGLQKVLAGVTTLEEILRVVA
jgi:type IV pilus assembly protein PilB